MSLILVIFLSRYFFFFKIYRQNMSIKSRLRRFDKAKRVFSRFVLCVHLVSHIIINYACHNSISELHAQCRMSLNSQRFLQFHPTVMLVVYVNSCFIIIRQNFFPVSFSSRIMKFSYCRVQVSPTTGHMNRGVYCRTDRNLCLRCACMKIKENWCTFYFKTR